MKEKTVIFNKIVEIRRIENSSITLVKELVTEVFMQFEAPDYSDEGVNAFLILRSTIKIT